MVKVKYFLLVVSVFARESFSKPQESPTTEYPKTSDYVYDYVSSYDYGNYDYGKQYGDYGKQYGDYGKQYGDYGKQYDDYVKQYNDYVKQYGDYGPTYNDYGDYDHVYDYGLYDDYTTDYTTDYSEYFVFGDRNNPLDTIVHVYDETGLQTNNEMPWVYIIVPVVQIDVMYVDSEHEGIEEVEMQFPIETFFFELGDFGLGHFDLGDFGIGDFREVGNNYGTTEDYLLADYGDYNDYPVYGHYQGSKVDLFDTADELSDVATLDYPGLDHDPYWIDWIFMIPPEEMSPVVP